MEKFLQETADGSHTISIPSMEVSYHSKHGAIQESMHVFIEAGLVPKINEGKTHLDILEIGFGTGLNTLLTLITARNISIHYESLEPFPLEEQMVASLNYCEQLGRPDLQDKFLQLHQSECGKTITIQPGFSFIKWPDKLPGYSTEKDFDIIYFDAFAPRAQPELWTMEIFRELYSFLKTEGVLVTYCSKSIVRRAMQAAGFQVEKIPGPHGKREMVRAIKSKAA